MPAINWGFEIFYFMQSLESLEYGLPFCFLGFMLLLRPFWLRLRFRPTSEFGKISSFPKFKHPYKNLVRLIPTIKFQRLQTNNYIIWKKLKLTQTMLRLRSNDWNMRCIPSLL